MKLVATFLVLFYLLADCSVLEYFSGNISLGIPAYNKTVLSYSASGKPDEIVFAHNSLDKSHLSGNQKSGLPLDDDDCFCCSSHLALGYSQMIVSIALPIVSRQIPSFFTREQGLSDSQLPPF